MCQSSQFTEAQWAEVSPLALDRGQTAAGWGSGRFRMHLQGGQVFYDRWMLHARDLSDAVEWILDRAGTTDRLAVVTCNVAHASTLRHDHDFQEAYDHADLRTVDSAPLALIATLLGHAARRCTGADLLPAVIKAAPPDLRIVVTGSSSDRIERAARNLSDDAACEVIGVPFPNVSRTRLDETSAVIDALTHIRPHITFVGLGAPKQELWVNSQRDRLPPGVYVCVGAAIDFASGAVARAPRFIRSLGAESLWRMLVEPRRLMRRYANDLPFLGRLLISALVTRSRVVIRQPIARERSAGPPDNH